MAFAVCRTEGCSQRWIEKDLGDIELSLTREIVCGGCQQPCEVDAPLGEDLPPVRIYVPQADPIAQMRAEYDARIAALEARLG